MSSRGINKVIIVGNLGDDPQVRYMPNGNAVANISVATSESWKDQQGQQQERTEWHRIVIFGKLAEIAGEYLRKGAQVYLEGKLQTRKWTDQSGVERYTTEIVADSMQMLGRKEGMTANQQQHAQGKGGYQDPAHQGQHRAAQKQRPAQNQPAQHQPQPQQNYTPDLDDGWDDDIPF